MAFVTCFFSFESMSPLSVSPIGHFMILVTWYEVMGSALTGVLSSFFSWLSNSGLGMRVTTRNLK